MEEMLETRYVEAFTLSLNTLLSLNLHLFTSLRAL